jgi:hypothetical protein
MIRQPPVRPEELLLLRPRVLAEWGSDVMEGGERKQPVEFPAAVRRTETIEITLPEGYAVDELPPPSQTEMVAASYDSRSEVKDRVLRYKPPTRNQGCPD